MLISVGVCLHKAAFRIKEGFKSGIMMIKSLDVFLDVPVIVISVTKFLCSKAEIHVQPC